ncbi:unnamed protein product [Mytilus edulis]|uniref:Integrase catalytic domain-containing protein n=1 Tax=Mytilus edulis TaxID=6550 RepID=A0A8S3SCX8_MYTED|nr:unnamed protein product [Mytilus edulis]
MLRCNNLQFIPPYEKGFLSKSHCHEDCIKLGDSLAMDCTYDSSSRTKPTVGGLPTTSEMCLAFLFYYPKVNVTFCLSQPNYDQLSSVPWHAVKQLNTWDWKDKSVRDNFNEIVDNSTYNYICYGLDKSANIHFKQGNFHLPEPTKRFLIRTDHSSLQWLIRFKNPEGQLARWLEVISSYDKVIKHRPGIRHRNADALSRIPCKQCGFVENWEAVGIVNMVQFQGDQADDLELDLRQLQETDSDLQTVIGWLTTGSKPSYSQTGKHSYVVKSLWSQWNVMKAQDGILLREDPETNLKQVVIPMKERRTIVEFAHDNRTADHLGIKKTLPRIKEKFYRPGVRGDTWSYIAGCSICNKKKKPIPKRKAPMQVKESGYPMERIAMDILGELPAIEKGNTYILVISDFYTNWTESHPMPNMEASTVANILMTEVISRFGVPTIIHSDQGSQFESHLFKKMCKLLQIEKTRTTPYHPKSDGMAERLNKTLATMLTGYVNEYHSNLDVLLPYVMMAYSSSQHETTGYTPNRLLGREVSTPLDLIYISYHPKLRQYLRISGHGIWNYKNTWKRHIRVFRDMFLVKC